MAAQRRWKISAIIWTGIAAGVVASVLFAPLITLGWCSDADETGTSECGSAQQSVLGIETNVWIWLGALAIIAIVTAVAARSVRRHARGDDHPAPRSLPR
ncbi:hypothetical protein [Microbacterium sp. SSM24]|uniref:hypothetical protein n=1 Tax=Microbacterium sp. SSM24 TaxID=2991714 RepID=UPI00222772D6|nr:hypothetical protein [Microbacterium sp. SSM24]MCW3493867.1 hypothetical protein [Microbacterium sp. SSM24]